MPFIMDLTVEKRQRDRKLHVTKVPGRTRTGDVAVHLNLSVVSNHAYIFYTLDKPQASP